MNAKKITVGTLAALFVIATGTTGYAYYVGNSTYPNASVISKIKYGFTNLKKSATGMTGSNAKDDINFRFDVTADLTIKKDGKTTDRTDLKIENGGLLSRSEGLQQRIQLGKIDFASSGTTSENFSLKGLDVVSDNEKVYSFVGEGMEKLLSGSGTSGSGDLAGKRELFSQLKGIYSQKKYSMFDNSKPMLRILGDFANDELVRKITVSLATSNPQAYFQKIGGDEQLKKFLLSDQAIGFVFQDGSQNSDGTKTNLTLNSQACKNLVPLMANIAKEIGEPRKDASPDEFAKECEKSVGELQPILSIATQIYKEGDVKAGNYRFVIAQGNVFELSISYKNHTMEKWSVNGNDPKGQLTLKGNGNVGSIENSLLKINLDLPAEYGSPSVKISGEIKDGSGKIEMDLSSSGSVAGSASISSAWGETDSGKPTAPVASKNFRGFVEMKNYALSEIDLSGSGTGSSYEPDFDFSIKGTGVSGKASYQSSIRGKTEEKAEFAYDVPAEKYHLDVSSEDLSGSAKYEKSIFAMNLIEKGFDGSEMGKMDMELNIPASTFHLNANSKFMSLKSKYEQSAFNLEYVQKGWDGTEMVKWDFSYSDKKIQGNIVQTGLGELHLKGDILTGNNLFDFVLDGTAMGEKINATLNGKIVSPSEKQFSLSANSDGKTIAEGLLKVVTSEENGFKVVKSNGAVSIPDEKTEAEFHADFRSKEGEIKYEIPTDFQEVDIKLMDMTTLPNMSQSQRYDQSKTMIAGVSAAAIIGTVGYISLQGYSQEARNAALRSKEITDERSRILREIQTWENSGESSIDDDKLVPSSGSAMPWEEMGLPNGGTSGRAE